MAEIRPSNEYDPATGRGKFSGELTADDMDGLESRTERTQRPPYTQTPKVGNNKPGKHRK